MAADQGFKAMWGRIAFPLGFASLIVAFIVGQIAALPDYEALMKQRFPNAQVTRVAEAEGGQIVFRDETAGNFLVISEGDGYGGPLAIAIRASAEGEIIEILDLDNKETPAYFNKMVKQRFFEQFARKKPANNYILDDDIDAVSGATVSSRGFTEAVRDAMHVAAVAHFKLEPTWQQQGLIFGLYEIGLIAVFAVAFLVTYVKGPVAKYGKYVMPVISLAIVGLYANASVSISQLAGIFLGYIPDFKQHMVWWIMMAGVIGSVVILGRNIYCGQVCPFQYVQRGLNKISGVNLAVKPGVQKNARTVVGWMTWSSLMLIFLAAHPTLGSYEPFSMMFSLNGVGVQWYILPLSLFGSFFILNFWCRLFCPVGLVLNESVRLRKSLLGRFTKPKKAAPKAAPKAAAPAQEEALPDDKGDLWRNEEN